MSRLVMLKPRLSTSKQDVATTKTRRLPGNWATLRRLVLRRDCGVCKCAECTAGGLLKLAHEVDHVIPRILNGSDDMSNLVAINHDCHVRKTEREMLAMRGQG